MAGSISSANREIREAERRDHARKLARLRRPRRLTDLLLTELEELNLDEVVEVPGRLRPSLMDLVDSVQPWPEIAARFGPRLRPGVRPTELIEIIFAIQEVLAPPPPLAVIEDEDDELVAAKEIDVGAVRKPEGGFGTSHRVDLFGDRSSPGVVEHRDEADRQYPIAKPRAIQ